MYLLRLFSPLLPRKVFIESALIIPVTFIIVFVFFSQPDLSEDVPLFAKIFNVLYPTMDVILISISLMTIRICGGRIHFSLIILLIGFFVQAIADFIYAYRTAAEVYWNGDISDILYMLGAFMMCMGMLAVRNSMKKPLVSEQPQSMSTVNVPPMPPMASQEQIKAPSA